MSCVKVLVAITRVRLREKMGVAEELLIWLFLLTGFFEEEALESGARVSRANPIDAGVALDEFANVREKSIGGVFQDDLGLVFGGDEVLESSFLDQASSVDDADVVTNFLHLFEEVGAEKDGDAAFLESENKVANLAWAKGIDTGRGLVEDDEAGILNECLGESNALEHAFGVASQPSVASVLETHEIEKFFGAILECVFGHAAELAVEAKGFLSGEVFVKIGILGEEADILPGVDLAGVFAEDRAGAGGRLHEAEEGLHGGGLAGAIGADESIDFAGADAEGDFIHGANEAATHGGLEVLDELVDFDCWRIAHLP
jgi:hypothetical protein